jgi:hypothetical protein
MKQGQASRSGPADRKVEPSPKAVNPGAVSYLGNKMGNHTTDDGDFSLNATSWNAGRGYRAPGIGATTHPSGSQGKHK